MSVQSKRFSSNPASVRAEYRQTCQHVHVSCSQCILPDTQHAFITGERGGTAFCYKSELALVFFNFLSSSVSLSSKRPPPSDVVLVSNDRFRVRSRSVRNTHDIRSLSSTLELLPRSPPQVSAAHRVDHDLPVIHFRCVFTELIYNGLERRQLVQQLAAAYTQHAQQIICAFRHAANRT